MKNIRKISCLITVIILFSGFIASCSLADGYATPAPSLTTATISDSPITTTAPMCYFEDQLLEKAIREAIQKPSGELSKADLVSIKELRYTGSAADPLISLKGIEQLVNLESLSIESTDLEDISALASLKNLKSLSLRYNRIKDITPLSSLHELQNLDLIHNLVEDIGPLASLENLTELSLDFNQISDLTPLKDLLKLTHLGFTENKVTNIQCLDLLENLQCLYMSGNYKINDYSPISELKSIRRISADFFNKENITILQSFPELYSVGFFGCEITPAPDEIKPDLAAYSQLLDEVDKILDTAIESSMTDYEKELAIYSYIVDNVAYGYVEGEDDYNAYSAYGALISNKCVCMGFSYALCLLMNKAGIDCISINDNADHAWNIVKLDDGYYHVDASRASMNHNKYKYFNMSDEVVKQDRQWDTMIYPECHGTKYILKPENT